MKTGIHLHKTQYNNYVPDGKETFFIVGEEVQ
jgi:hypothetical protein